MAALFQRRYRRLTGRLAFGHYSRNPTRRQPQGQSAISEPENAGTSISAARSSGRHLIPVDKSTYSFRTIGAKRAVAEEQWQLRSSRLETLWRERECYTFYSRRWLMKRESRAFHTPRTYVLPVLQSIMKRKSHSCKPSSFRLLFMFHHTFM